jgi:hypothetical protein
MADDSSPLPSLDRVKIGLMHIGQIPFHPSTASPRPDGLFVVNTISWPRQNVLVAGLRSGYFVQEIRVDGMASPNGIVTVGPGSQLEVVLDNQPSTLTGTVTDGHKPAIRPRIYATKWPMDSPRQLRPR